MKSGVSARIAVVLLLTLQPFPRAGFDSSADTAKLQIGFEGDPVSYTVASFERGRVLYVSVEEFADALGFASYVNARNGKTVLRIGSRSVKISPYNPFIMIDDAVVHMPLPTASMNGRLYVPLAHFLDALGGSFPYRPSLQQERRVLLLSKVRRNITEFDAEAKGNGVVIRLHTTRRFSPSDIAVSVQQGWLHVTLFGGVLDTVQMASEGISGIFQKMVSYQFDKSAQLSFLFGRDVIDRQVSVDANGVTLSVWSSDAPIRTATAAVPDAVRSRWLIDTIIIDPGHGGRDPGTIGRTGTKEKEVNLEIGQRLRDLLKAASPRTRVLMTRSTDVFVGLKERGQFANAQGGKLFISIHANANTSRSARGYSTYFLGVGKTQQAVEVARRENSVIQYEEAPEAYQEYQDFDYILNAIALSSYLKESQQLAEMVNGNLGRRTKIPDQGVHQMGLLVLIGASMPGILVETAFLSNTHEERLLRTRSFQQSVAEALCESVQTFKKKSEEEIG
jgi:N-acetylmuramoyl-L-alanine amidase